MITDRWRWAWQSCSSTRALTWTSSITAAHAVSVAKKRVPHVLLLDIGLPILNGYQVAAEFRSDSKLRNVLIIAISAYSPHMFPSRPAKDDFNHYLVKPVEFHELLPLIGRAH